MNVRKFSSIITLVRREGQNENLYLLKKRKKEHKAMFEFIECPEEKVKTGETYKNAALREYLEETGTKANKLVKQFRFTKFGVYEGRESKRIITVFKNIISLGEEKFHKTIKLNNTLHYFLFLLCLFYNFLHYIVCLFYFFFLIRTFIFTHMI